MLKQIFLVITIIFILAIFNCMYTKMYLTEGFEAPDISNSQNVKSGASHYYSWGDTKPDLSQPDTKPNHPPTCNKPKPPPTCNKPKPPPGHHKRNVYVDNEVYNVVVDKTDCSQCDITENKDISKYVLKSSVPPCPDMSKYALKSMIEPKCPNMDEYIKKTELHKYCNAYRPDMSKYILKSQIPKCPAVPKCKKLDDFDITKHSDFNKYMLKDDCIKFKHSWINTLQDWQHHNQVAKHKTPATTTSKGNVPHGYGFSPYAGFGTNNPGYGLGGEVVVSKYDLKSKEAREKVGDLRPHTRYDEGYVKDGKKYVKAPSVKGYSPDLLK